MPWSMAAAATSSSTPSGTGTRDVGGPVDHGAGRTEPGPHATRSPTATSSTPAPTAVTVPAPSEQETNGVGDRVDALPLVDVDEVDADRRDLDLRLAVAGRCDLDVLHLQDRGVTVAGDDEGA